MIKLDIRRAANWLVSIQWVLFTKNISDIASVEYRNCILEVMILRPRSCQRRSPLLHKEWPYLLPVISNEENVSKEEDLAK